MERAELAALAAEQWGMLTTSQASQIGVSKMALSRMAAAGELERVIHGVYAVPATADAEHVLERAMWLTLDPDARAGERVGEAHSAGVLSHESAARLLGLGDLIADVVTITVPTRRRTRRPDLRLRADQLQPEEVTLVEGLPVTKAARTIADLLADGDYDLEHLSQMTAQAVERGLCDEAELQLALTRASADAGGPERIRSLLQAADADLVDAAAARLLSSAAGQAAIARAVQELLNSAGVLKVADLPVLDAETMRAVRSVINDALPAVDWAKLDVRALSTETTRTALNGLDLIPEDERRVLRQKANDARRSEST